MRTQIAVLGLTLALAACGGKEPTGKANEASRVTPEDARRAATNVVIRPDVPNVVDKSLLGSKLAADGTVAEETSTFKAGEPVVLTIWIKQSPPGLRTGVIWYGKDDKPLERDKRPMNGAKVVTFALKEKLKPGKYRVEGYWGGNVVADKSFEVTGRKKKS